MQISFRILGPLTAELRAPEDGARPAELDTGPVKQRLLLALLLCRSNNVVPMEELVDALWWEGPPRTAHKNIQVYISHLRKLLGSDGLPGRLVYRPSGYQLVLTSAEVDALRFEDLSRTGRVALRRGDARESAAAMREALGLWRGPALADLQVSPALREEAARLDDRRLSVYEDWFEAELLLGNHAEVLDEIEAVVRGHPLRERLRSHQLTALYRGGRQAEALAEYDNLRQLLTAELGLDPSPALQQLYQGILSGRLAVSPPAPAPPPVSAPVLAPAAARRLDSPEAGPDPGRAPVPAEVVAHVSGLPDTAERPDDLPGQPGGPWPQPGARSAAGRPSGLPREVANFTGRRGMLGDLLALFGHEEQAGSHLRRFAVIVGPPGAGKSTLALQAAHVLAPRFRDGPVLLSLRDGKGAPRPSAELIEELLGLLEPFPGPAAAGGPDRSALLRRQLASLQLLLIMDGVTDEAQVRPLLPGAGDCSVILTSCRTLSGLDGVSHFNLGVFTEEEALELLSRLVGAERVARERAAALRIVRACGMLPLAVRVAGARLGGLAHLPLERFADRLEDGDRLLDELTVGDLSVRGRFDRYLQGLGFAERLALMLVAAAWSPPSTDPSGMEQLLESLVGVHALTITGRCARAPGDALPFAMPAPLWACARQLLSAAVGDAGPEALGGSGPRIRSRGGQGSQPAS